MRFDPAIFERVVSTYEGLGLPRAQSALWSLPQRDARLVLEPIDPARHRRILEIGTYVGVSTMLMALHAPHAIVHSVDPNLPLEIGTPGAGVEHGAVAATGAQDLAAEAARRLGVADRVKLHEGGFAVAADFATRRGEAGDVGADARRRRVVGPSVCREHGPFDVVFVDGLHYADAVLADLSLVVDFLAPGGVILLHDVIGLWGGNVRWAVHRLLERRPEFVFWHEPYREVYLSVGVLARRGEAATGAGVARPHRTPGPRLIDEPRLRTTLLSAACGDASIARLVELRAASTPSFAAEAEARGTALLSREVADLSACMRALDDLPPAAVGELMLCLGVLDDLDDAAADVVLRRLASRGRPVVFGFTPPGERGVAGPFSRTLPTNMAKLAAAGLKPIRDITLALEPALAPYWTHTARGNSHLLHLLIALPVGTAAAISAGAGVDAAAVERRALGELYRDLLILHTTGQLPAPSAEAAGVDLDAAGGATELGPHVASSTPSTVPATSAEVQSHVALRGAPSDVLEWTPCPLCAGVQSDEVYTRPDHRHQVDGTRFRVVRCRDCGFAFVNPRPDAASIARWYPPEFYGAGDDAAAALDAQHTRLEAMAAWLGHLPPGRLLDVGCYKGEFMLWMARRGWTVRGVEFTSTPPNLFGLDIHHGDIAAAPWGLRDDDRFDVITVWAVLEHVLDPRTLLRECARRLRPGGRLFVLVPNFRSIPARFLLHDDIPRHLLMFTPATLRKLLGESGFTTRQLRCEQSIYSGSVRGTLNYVAKLLAGERHDEIVAQNRVPGRWLEFACELRGAPSRLMERIDRLDQRATPWLDRALDRVGLGFIMTAEAERT